MATQTVNYGLTKPTWDELVDVSVLNGNADIIDVQMKANQDSATQAVANIAGAYDATATYAVGDFVTYNNKFYVCETAVSTPEAFDDTKWVETTASEHFGEGGGGDASKVELTQAEYDALTPAEQMNGTMYFLTDVNGDGQSFQPIIYSDTEREVGVWRDGKPLYQRTVYISSLPNNATVTYPHLIDDVDLIFTSNCFVITGSANTADVMLTNDSLSAMMQYFVGRTNIEIWTGTNRSSWSAYFTLQYTKTTDTAGSGTWTPQGVPAIHYSTDEQVIGTWIDGSTLYQKTIDLESNVSISNSSPTDLNVSISNLERIIDGMAVTSGADYCCPIMVIFDPSNDTTIKAQACKPSGGISCRFITIKYTKATS